MFTMLRLSGKASLLLALVLAVTGTVAVGSPPNPVPPGVPRGAKLLDAYIVEFDRSVDALTYAKSLGLPVEVDETGRRDCFISINGCVIPGPAFRAIDLENNPKVVRITQDFVREDLIDMVPNDARYAEQWGPPAINMEQAWDISTGSSSRVTLFIMDTGLNPNFIEGFNLNYDDEFRESRVAGNLDLAIMGYDAVNQDQWAQDGHGHGTHVTGIAAATGNNLIGIAGITWNNIAIYPIKAIADDGTATESMLIRAFDFMYDIASSNPSKEYVINMSWGVNPAICSEEAPMTHGVLQCVTDALHNAFLASAQLTNVVDVAATGNDYHSDQTGNPIWTGYINFHTGWPAVDPYTVAVGAVEADGYRCFGATTRMTHTTVTPHWASAVAEEAKARPGTKTATAS